MILVRKTIETEMNVFDVIGVRELARATGLDVGYLSRVKNNQIAISPERLQQLWAAADRLSPTKEAKG